MIKKVQEIWLGLIGNPADFPLERRIFHSISVGLTVLAAFYTPYDLFEGLYVASASSLIFSLFFFYQFYNSRYRGRPHNSVFFALVGLVIFSVNYFTTSGILGSTDVIWPAYLLLVFAISPYRQHLVWLIVYFVTFLAIHIIAYQYPELVKYPFNLGKGMLIDRITAFPLPVIVIYMAIKYMRNSYDNEKKAVEEKAIAIELRNQQISQQKDELEQSNAEKNKLMSIISHDLRTPLISIQNYLELLNNTDLESLERPALEKELLTATDNTMEMLSNLLHWSRSQMEGTIVVKVVPVNLLDTVQNTLAMAEMQARKKDIALSSQISPQLTVMADTDMLQLVVRNLLNNAIKFTPPGGTITATAQADGDKCKLTITDTGQGIATDKQQTLFSIQTQPAFGTRNEKGVGLGLLLCKEFIERQGGSIGFESTPGKGSSFFVFVPMAKEQRPAPAVMKCIGTEGLGPEGLRHVYNSK